MTTTYESVDGSFEGSKESWLVRHIPLHSHDSPGEERANGLTHGFAAALSVAASVLAVHGAVLHGGAERITAIAVYGVSLFLLYSASTLYHFARGPRLKRALRIVDHSSIYLLIAGTYTPVALIYLGGPVGWLVFGIEWGLAVVGILLKVFLFGKLKVPSLVSYLAMGWLALLFWQPLVRAVPAVTIWWLVAGGLFYTAGIIFFGMKRLRYHHAIWHLMVLAGSASHFLGIILFIPN